MKTPPIAETIERLRNALERHNRLYYVEAAPEISDLEFDRLLKELEALEEAHPEFDRPDSPTKKVGGEPVEGFETVTHREPMLSIENVYDETALEEYDTRIRKLLAGKTVDGEKVVEESEAEMEVEPPAVEYTVEYKIDGVALALIYENGVLVQAVTRGNGEQGDDVTHNARTIGGVPLKLAGDAFPKVLEIRGEAYISNSDFSALLVEQEAAGAKKLFANPRNTAAGALKLLDPKEAAKRRLRFLAHGLGYHEGLKSRNHLEYLDRLREAGVPVTPRVEKVTTIAEARDRAHLLGKDIHALDLEVDGIVIKVNDFAQREQLGVRSKSPRWAIAYKWEKHEAVTILEDIVVQVGKSGKLTPVAHLTPVDIDRTVVARASLHNRDEIERLGVKLGDRVVVEKAGKIIPHVLRVEEHLRDGSERDFQWPETCPGCGGETVSRGDSVDLFCANPESCQPQLLRQLEYFTSRPAMDIAHLGEKLVAQLVDEGLLASIPDIYHLPDHADALLAMERFGERSRDNLLKAIEQSKQQPLWRLITGLSIPDVGSSTARLLEAEFGSLDQIAAASEEDLTAIDGIGPQTTESLLAFFENADRRAMIEELRGFGLNFGVPVDRSAKAAADAEAESGPLAGKTVVVTGTLPSLSRPEAEELIRQAGGKASSSVSKRTSYVLAGERAGSKLTKAESLGIPVLDEEKFRELLKTQEPT